MLRNGLRAAGCAGASVVAMAIFGPGTASAQNAAPECPANYEVTAPVGVNTPIVGQCDDPDDGPQPLNYTIVDWPDFGSLGGSSDGNGVYRPYSPFTEPTDTFTYRASDGAAQSALSTVTITIVPPPPGNQAPFCPDSHAFVEDDSQVTLAGNCVDPEGDSIFYGLVPPSPTKGSLSILSASSVSYDPFPTTVGPTTDKFGYSARDDFHASENVVVDIDILPSGATTFASAPEATETEQYVAGVESPNGGPVNIDRRTTTAIPPDGFFMLNEEFDIEAPPASAGDPLRLTFTFDESVAIGELLVIRNGNPVPPCTTPGVLDPEPTCVGPVEPVGTDNQVTVLTTNASIWTFATRPDPPHSYGFDGFDAPVGDRPDLNVAKGGSTVPVKFELGEDAGDDPFAAGYPKSQEVDCGSSGDVNGIDSVSDPGASGLKHDGTRYQLNWQTKGEWAGTCRQLVLRFDDEASSTVRADFRLR